MQDFASPEITATQESKLFDVAVHPNPVSGIFNVQVHSQDGITPVSVRILSLDGRLVSINKSIANSTLKLESGKWRSGMYFVEVTQGKDRKIVKLIKM